MTTLPNATTDQTLSIEFALRMVDPALHDGPLRNLSALLDPAGFSDHQLQQALGRVLNDSSGVRIPGSLFPRLGLNCVLSQAQHGQSALAAGATLKA
jgi:hypothetical protein